MKNDIIPPDEWELLEPIIDGVETMIELGNKRNPNGTYKAVFVERGIQHTSVDWNGADGALALDLREDLVLEDLGLEQPVDVVTNYGTTEHCDPQGRVWHNILRWLKVGGHFISVTPRPWQWAKHGIYYPTLGWYQKFCDLNGLTVKTMYVGGVRPRELNCLRAKKVEQVDNVRLPDDDLMYENRRST